MVTMANEGGSRSYWPSYMGVNLSNGNLHFAFGNTSCVTCGGGATQSYPSPMASRLTGPVLIFNSLGTPATDLGPHWMLPYMASATTDSEGNVTILDYDGTVKEFTSSGGDVPAYSSSKESDVLTATEEDYILTRCNGDQWRFPKTEPPTEGEAISFCYAASSRPGQSWEVTRDGNDRITKVTDAYDREILFFYDTFNSITRLTEIREPAPGDVGFISTYLGYDADGRLAAITNGVGETTKFVYNGSDQLVTAIDGHGHPTNYTYTSGKVTNIEDNQSNDTVFAYTSTTTTVTNRLSEDTVYTFDASGRVTKITNALLQDTEFTRDSTTWELTQTLGHKIDLGGGNYSQHRTLLTYGTTSAQHELHKRRLYKLTGPMGTNTLLTEEDWTYNAQHDVETYENPLGKVTTYGYKIVSGASIGLIETVTNAESEVIATYTYELVNGIYRADTFKNGVNKTWSYDYDQNTANSYGIPDKVTAPSGAITNSKIDVRGRQYEVTPPTGNTSKIVYDAVDRAIQMINPDGTSTSSVYDCCHLVAEVDENGHSSTYEHDDMGRLSKVTDANGDETTYEYNAEGWQTSVTDPRGNETTFAHDEQGRVTLTTYPGGWTEAYTYWEPEMVKSKTNAKSGGSSTTINYEYDDFYRLKKVNFPSGTDTEIEYDAASRKTKMKDASGEKRYYYDDADRLIKVEQGPTGFVVGTNHDYVLEYAWNAASQRTQKKLTIRTQSAKTWDYVYLDDGELDTVTNPDSDVTDHQYLTDGRLKKIVLDTGSTREFFYQDTNDSHAYVASKNSHLRKTLDKKSGGTVICSFAYELDAAGIRRSITDKDSKYRAFGYDPKYQLKAETFWTAKVPGSREDTWLWSLDPNGNRLTQHFDGVLTSYVYGSNNEMTDAGTADFTFDHFGNTASIVGVQAFTYNFDNCMTQVSYSGSLGVDTREYDGNMRRMRSKFNSAANWTNYIHDELTENLICEYTLVSGTYSIKALNTYGLGLISSNRESTIRYFHFDGLGTTYHLTDTSQNVTDSYSYNAFGVPRSSSGSSVNPYRYVGQWGDYDDGARGSSSGMLLLGVRYYWPAFGRFTTGDPGSSSDLYSYADASPTMFVDVEGRSPQRPTDLLTGPSLWNPFARRARLFGDCIRCARRVAREMDSEKLKSKAGAITFADNALRHCVWACKVAKRCPGCGDVNDWKELQDLAWDWLFSAEDTLASVARDSVVDLWNNMVGRAVAEAAQCLDACQRWQRLGCLR